jgi:hypothetical protein
MEGMDGGGRMEEEEEEEVQQQQQQRDFHISDQFIRKSPELVYNGSGRKTPDPTIKRSPPRAKEVNSRGLSLPPCLRMQRQREGGGEEAERLWQSVLGSEKRVASRGSTLLCRGVARETGLTGLNR